MKEANFDGHAIVELSTAPSALSLFVFAFIPTSLRWSSKTTTSLALCFLRRRDHSPTTCPRLRWHRWMRSPTTWSIRPRTGSRSATSTALCEAPRRHRATTHVLPPHSRYPWAVLCAVRVFHFSRSEVSHLTNSRAVLEWARSAGRWRFAPTFSRFPCRRSVSPLLSTTWTYVTPVTVNLTSK